jgi:probable H4MPT-linked C1 transfer pathway protein
MGWLALDIGGAHIKLANTDKYALTYAMPLWRDKNRLANELRMLLTEAPPSDHVAVTMTGELADCFKTRAEGVEYIVQSVVAAADGRHLRFYRTDGKLVAAPVAARAPELVASSNWHALGRYATRWAKGTGIVIDVGSTTTDILPIAGGRLVNIGNHDTQRLVHSELIYTGVERSPVAGIVREVPYRGDTCQVMNELFATTGDVYLLTDELTESRSNRRTADGEPATKSAARRRLGRLIGAPDNEFNHRDAALIAQHVVDTQVQMISNALQIVESRLDESPQHMIIAGQGEFLAARVIRALGLHESRKVISLAKRLGPRVSRAAPAYALAKIAVEMQTQ